MSSESSDFKQCSELPNKKQRQDNLVESLRNYAITISAILATGAMLQSWALLPYRITQLEHRIEKVERNTVPDFGMIEKLTLMQVTLGRMDERLKRIEERGSFRSP